MSHIKLAAIAAAVGSLCCGAAQAQSAYTAAAGASAQRTTIFTEFATACPGGAATVQVFQAVAAEGGGNVRAARCGAAGEALSLDTDGGSWRAYAVQNLAQINAQAGVIAVTDPTIKRIRYLNLALCPATGGTIGTPVSCNAGAAVVVPTSGNGTTVPNGVTVGFSDVNPAFFDGFGGVDLGVSLNRPNGFQNWPKLTSATTASPTLGIVFGVAASRTLYQALMNDQGITAANSPTCWTGATADLANESCAPTITKDQYRSIATANFGQLNTSFANLFLNAVPAAVSGAGVTLERRDYGSGTQAAANAYFHGVGCTPYYIPPAAQSDSGAPYIVNENAATGDVIAKLGTAGAVSVGIVSRENAPSATGGWGFLKLSSEKGATYAALTTAADAAGTTHPAVVQGAYPHQNNAIRGLYDFWTVGFLFTRTSGVTYPAVINTAITNLKNGNVGAYIGAGTLKLSGLATGTNGLSSAVLNTGTFYGKDGMQGACVGATGF